MSILNVALFTGFRFTGILFTGTSQTSTCAEELFLSPSYLIRPSNALRALEVCMLDPRSRDLLSRKYVMPETWWLCVKTVFEQFCAPLVSQRSLRYGTNFVLWGQFWRTFVCDNYRVNPMSHHKWMGGVINVPLSESWVYWLTCSRRERSTSVSGLQRPRIGGYEKRPERGRSHGSNPPSLSHGTSTCWLKRLN